LANNVSAHDTVYLKRVKMGPALVAHAWNPSYSGGRDQEDGGLEVSLGK
jgi:hypothetical protein